MSDVVTKTKKPLSVKALIAEAKKGPAKTPYICPHDVGAATDALLKAGMTHKAIAEWFEARGHSWGPQSIMNGWRHWKTMLGSKK